MRPKSSTLFHFTKSLDTLQEILLNGFWPKYCLEDTSWLGNAYLDFVAFPIVCFCDIPLSRIDEHVEFYGRYGIGMTKEWANKNGLNPVMYLSGQNSLTTAVMNLAISANHLKENEEDKFWQSFRHINAFIKPCTGRMVVGSSPLDKEFYQESEWRYTPHIDGIQAYLRRKDFLNENILRALNEVTKSSAVLKFLPSDVRYLFVKEDSDIPSLVNFIEANLDHYPSYEMKILLSRITSLQSIGDDI